MQNQLLLFFCQGQTEEPVQFFGGFPHGIVRAKEHMLHPIGADDFRRPGGGQGVQGGRGVHVNVFPSGQGGSRGPFPFAVAPQMSADGHQIREQIQHVVHALRAGIVVTIIAGMNQQRKSSGHGADHLQNPWVVQAKALNVRMNFHPQKAGADDLVHGLFHVRQIRMQSGEGQNAIRISGVGGEDEAIDGFHLSGGGGHGMGHKPAYPGAIHARQGGGKLSVQRHGNIIEFPYGPGGLFGDFIRENMHVKIDDVHNGLPSLCLL